MAVYFVGVTGDATRIKIGKAYDVPRRLIELQRWGSSAWRVQSDVAPLELVATCDGYSDCEAALHRMLAAHRVWGEWFDATAPRVQQVIAYVRNHGAGALRALMPDAFERDAAAIVCDHGEALRAADGSCVLCGNTAPTLGVELMPLRTATAPLEGTGLVRDTSSGSHGTDECSGTASAAPIEPARAAEVGGSRAPGTPSKGPGVAGSGSNPPQYPNVTQDAHVILQQLGVKVARDDQQREDDAREILAELTEYERQLDEAIGRESLQDFFEQAVRAGAVPGVKRLEPAPYINAICSETQAMLEGWLVANGKGTPGMLARQAAHWRRHFTDTALLSLFGSREPWLKQPLVQNWCGNICPSTLKSTIIMVVANAWIWLHDPSFKFGAASGIDANVKRDSNAARDLVTHAWYRNTYAVPWSVRENVNAQGLWEIVNGDAVLGGFRLSRSMGQGFTGQHVDGEFIDDPDDADKVWGEPARAHVQDKWTRAIENRVPDERVCIRMVLQQRVHMVDLTGYLVSILRWEAFGADDATHINGWAQFVLPMEFGRGPKDAPSCTPFGWHDWRTRIGEVLDEQRFPKRVLDDKREKLTDWGFEAQYNQNPTPINGGLVGRQHIRFFVFEGTNLATLTRKRPEGCLTREECPPIVLKRDVRGALEVDCITITIDCSGGSEAVTASAVSLQVCACKDELRLVLDDRTKVMGVQEQYDRIFTTVADWSPQCGRVIIEAKALGASAINELQKRIDKNDLRNSKGERVMVQAVVEGIKIPADDGKVVRARAAVPTFEQQHVYVLDGAPWLYPRAADKASADAGLKIPDEGWIAEVCGFPFAKRNDRMDAFAQFITYYRENSPAEKRARALNVW